MSATAQALSQGRTELRRRCDNLRQIAQDVGHPSDHWLAVAHAIDAVEVRVVVVGEVNRGKSTFLNALIGRRIFPPRATVCTAVLTELRDGAPSGEAFHRDGHTTHLPLPDEDIASVLLQVVSKKNPNAGLLERVRLYFPNRFATDGIVLIDTPGVNDTEQWREEITRAAVLQADAAIFLLDPQTPLRQTERIFLQESVHHRVEDRVIFVVTKKDQVSSSDLEDAMDRLGKVLSEIVKNPRIIPVSSKDALEARARGDVEAFNLSGFSSCERTLDTFLCKERVALELTARRAAIRALGSGLYQDLSMRLSALDREDRSLKQRVEKARHQFDLDIARIEQERRCRYATNDMLKCEIISRADGVWSKSASTYLLSDLASAEVLQAYRLNSSAGRDTVRDRLGRARRDADREIYADFHRLAKHVSKGSKSELIHMDEALCNVERMLSASEGNAALKIASAAWEMSQKAFREASQAQRLDETLLVGAAGIIAGVVGILAGLAGLLVGAVVGVGADPTPVIRTALRNTSEGGRILFHSEVGKQAQRIVDRENAQVDATIREQTETIRRTLSALEKAALSDGATLVRERDQLRRHHEAVRNEMEHLG